MTHFTTKTFTNQFNLNTRHIIPENKLRNDISDTQIEKNLKIRSQIRSVFLEYIMKEKLEKLAKEMKFYFFEVADFEELQPGSTVYVRYFK